ncbi:MAG: hypothetical protein HYZ08_01180 [Candidatus Kerfeldbacteria bacterium]|nr:hypothetical protein [Candidatus Kerfeldbacteria bacterium]
MDTFVVQELHKWVEITNSCRLLKAMDEDHLTPEQWKLWGVSRWRISWAFERFLFGALRQAERAGLDVLAYVLRQNLNDELGIDRSGIVHPDRAHETWRREFYGAIGLTYHEAARAVGNAQVPSAVQPAAIYCGMISEILATEDPLISAGALWFLETEIPDELRSVELGLSHLGLPEQRWVKDHILHDRQFHAKGLQHALDQSVQFTGLGRLFDPLVLCGIQRAADAKQAYFEAVEKVVL